MGKSSSIQSHTDKYSLIGALDPDTDEIKPVKLGDGTVLGLGVQLYVWDSDSLAWVKMQQPTIEAGDLYVAVDQVEAKLDTVNANLGTMETTLNAIQAAVELIDNAIAGSEMQVDVVTSALPSGAATSANQGTIITALQKIDDIQNALKSVDTDELVSRLTDSAGTEINPAKEDGNLSSIKTAVEIIDNFISGSRGLVTEDNSAAIKTAVEACQTALELLDNAIAGNELQVDVVSSALPSGAATSAKQDTLISAVQDQRDNYRYTGFLEDGTDAYVGYEDEDGNYFIEKHPSSGLTTFTAGSGGIPATGTWTGLSYTSFADTF